ncbi:MAG: recombination protein RecR [Rhodospirillaceae bacterium]|nr:recombination protein RecR [Rhodospirillaceae bacterium]
MTEIERLIQLLSRLPGFGPRSARRAVLHLIKRRETVMQPLVQALSDAADAILVCSNCGNLDTVEPCTVCRDEDRDRGVVCVVEDVADLWALERTRSFRGQYHVLGGRLSALDGIGPEDLNIAGLIGRAEAGDVNEVILAMNLTVDGQTTAHYIADRLEHTDVEVTRLAHGVPVGGELDYLDDGTLETALRSRRTV